VGKTHGQQRRDERQHQHARRQAIVRVGGEQSRQDGGGPTGEEQVAERIFFIERPPEL